jgi:hypothetical protein
MGATAERVCVGCGGAFVVPKYRTTGGGARYCTIRCASLNRHRPTHEERFWSYVDKGAKDGCWEWRGNLDAKGYGRFGVDYRIVAAHRFSYKISKGEPGKLYVCHKCDNPCCVRPDHLFLGTYDDNMRDMREKGRGTKPPTKRGEANLSSKLTEELVIRMRKDRDAGASVDELARRFGVGKSTVCRVVSGQSWKHVP